MATIYRVYHATMDRYVAIKVLPERVSLNTEICKRFEREAKVIAKLTHALVLPVHDYGMAGNMLLDAQVNCYLTDPGLAKIIEATV